jgi:hypothetical protein
MPEVALNLDRLRQTGGDPGVGTSSQAPRRTPNPRVRVLERPPSPSPDPPAYWPMEPSDPATPLRGLREPPCIIHGWGPCPYPVVMRQTELSSPSPIEGGEEVTIAKGEEEEDPVEVILVLNSPLRLTPTRMARIQVGTQGRPTRILAPRSRASEADRGVTHDRI